MVIIKIVIYCYCNWPWWSGRQSQWWQQTQQWCCSGALAARCPGAHFSAIDSRYCMCLKNMLYHQMRFVHEKMMINHDFFGTPSSVKPRWVNTFKACPYQLGGWTSINLSITPFSKSYSADRHKNRLPIDDARSARMRMTGWLKKPQGTINIRPLVAFRVGQALHYPPALGAGSLISAAWTFFSCFLALPPFWQIVLLPCCLHAASLGNGGRPFPR